MENAETVESGSSNIIPEEVVEGAETFEDFYHAIESQMMDYVKKSYKVPETSWEQFQAFLAAVNWNEKLIVGLICFHVTLLLIFILFRRNLDVQMVLFLLISGLVYFSENVNKWGSTNWRDFASQNYFDKSGVFMGIFYAGPMLLIATAQLVRYASILSLLFVPFCFHYYEYIYYLDQFAFIVKYTTNCSKTRGTEAASSSTEATAARQCTRRIIKR